MRPNEVFTAGDLPTADLCPWCGSPDPPVVTLVSFSNQYCRCAKCGFLWAEERSAPRPYGTTKPGRVRHCDAELTETVITVTPGTSVNDGGTGGAFRRGNLLVDHGSLLEHTAKYGVSAWCWP